MTNKTETKTKTNKNKKRQLQIKTYSGNTFNEQSYILVTFQRFAHKMRRYDLTNKKTVTKTSREHKEQY